MNILTVLVDVPDKKKNTTIFKVITFLYFFIIDNTFQSFARLCSNKYLIYRSLDTNIDYFNRAKVCQIEISLTGVVDIQLYDHGL